MPAPAHLNGVPFAGLPGFRAFDDPALAERAKLRGS